MHTGGHKSLRPDARKRGPGGRPYGQPATAARRKINAPFRLRASLM
jgi:hypothetical protein